MITALVVADYLGLELSGEDIAVVEPVEVQKCMPGALVWVKAPDLEKIEAVNSVVDRLVICGENAANLINNPKIIANKPRLEYIKALALFVGAAENPGIHPTAVIDASVALGVDISVGPYSIIRGNVSIGNGTIIGDHVTVEGRVEIGANCYIKHGAVIGAPGFGFEYDESGKPLHFPHIGRVIIGDRVFVGSNSTVERATLGETNIEDDVKIDDLVQIGHNTSVGSKTLIMANVVLCGGARVGKRCWIAPNVSVRQLVKIADGATVGMGSVVVSDVGEGEIVAGVPAKVLPAKRDFKGVNMKR